MKTIKDFDIKNKRVIIRCDFNVPIKDGVITDDTRILASIETITYALRKEAKVILLSHLNRVKTVEDLSKNTLKPVAEKLAELLKQEVKFWNKKDMIIDGVNNLQPGELALLENTRFYDYPNKLESNNSLELAKFWASLGDIFINDAFGTSHRAHASNVGIANLLPAGIGFLIEKELKELSRLEKPQRPYLIILGGAKVKDKIGLIENLLTKADYILVAGGIGNTFIKAKGLEVGKSLVDEESITFCQKLLNNKKIIMPRDVLVAKEISQDAAIRTVNIDNIAPDDICLDIGPKTIAHFDYYIQRSNMIVWNGTVGLAEYTKFANGTRIIAHKMAESRGLTFVAGGDTAAALVKLGYRYRFNHISTGGGATITLLEGAPLPGIEVIANKEE